MSLAGRRTAQPKLIFFFFVFPLSQSIAVAVVAGSTHIAGTANDIPATPSHRRTGYSRSNTDESKSSVRAAEHGPKPTNDGESAAESLRAPDDAGRRSQPHYDATTANAAAATRPAAPTAAAAPASAGAWRL